MNEFYRTMTVTVEDMDGSWSVNKNYEDEVPWSALLEDFVSLLEASGYVGVRERISVRHTPYVTEGWSGPQHDVDDWK